MPWFPDFASAVALARRQTRAAGRADPAAEYFTALTRGDPDRLETVWPGEVVIYDPRAGEIRGHRRLARFVRDNQAWLADRQARIETVATTSAEGRAVLETLAQVDHDDERLVWPVAVVADSLGEQSVAFRTYCSQVPVDGRRHVRPPVLEPGPTQLSGMVARFLTALEAGDVGAVLATFDPNGYLHAPTGPHAVHRGARELGAYFTQLLNAGGITLDVCAVTDDGVRCAVEYNCARWGGHDLPAQAGLVVVERGRDGRLAAVRRYDDLAPPSAVGAAV
jgi:hypothetical protein